MGTDEYIYKVTGLPNNPLMDGTIHVTLLSISDDTIKFFKELSSSQIMQYFSYSACFNERCSGLFFDIDKKYKLQYDVLKIEVSYKPTKYNNAVCYLSEQKLSLVR